MTFREKVAKEHPECLDEYSKGGVMGCPCSIEYKYEQDYWCGDGCGHHDNDGKCTECWDREIPTTPIQKATSAFVAMGTALKEHVSSYNQGLQDAWELAKKIAMEKSNGGFDVYEIVGIFGFNDMDAIFMSYTPQEALAKLKAYEEAQEEKRKAEEMAKIHVGDVVKYDGIQAVVMDIDTVGNVALFTENACIESWIPQCLVKKTSKNIDVESLLGQIRGE